MRTMFEDRADAGRQLAEALQVPEPEHTVVLALPRGGVPIAAEICRKHHLPLDLILVRKIGAPYQPELAVGAIVDGDKPTVFINVEIAEVLGLSHEEIERQGKTLLPEIERRRALYLGGRAPQDLAGKTAIVVDDGVATGASLQAALGAVRARGPARIIVALPVGARDTVEALRQQVDDVVCVAIPPDFQAVGAHYRRFPQCSDETVTELVSACNPLE